VIDPLHTREVLAFALEACQGGARE
jgi:hypothetical protein